MGRNSLRGPGLATVDFNVSKNVALTSQGTYLQFRLEVFNLFNAINPSGFRARVIVPASGASDPALLEPTTYSGDFRRPEQRLGQLGLRFTF